MSKVSFSSGEKNFTAFFIDLLQGWEPCLRVEMLVSRRAGTLPAY
jgi:hypothetical protein